MNFEERKQLLNKTFTPRSPINERQLFSGRIDQLDKLQKAVDSPGTHAVLYGERGVGKTSLANVAEQIMPISRQGTIAIKVTCNTSDDYSSVLFLKSRFRVRRRPLVFWERVKTLVCHFQSHYLPHLHLTT